MRTRESLLWIVLIVLITAIGLSACATTAPVAPPRADQVSFDRGAFALAYAGLVNPMLAKCAKTAGVLQTPACVELISLDAQVRQAILDAPKIAASLPPTTSNPLDQLMPLILKLAPLLAGGL